jgi:hypothetical protein
MDNIAPVLVYIIPIAAVIVLRTLAAKKRAEAKAKKAQASGGLTERAAAFEKHAAEPEEWQPHWLEEEGEEAPAHSAPPDPRRYDILPEAPHAETAALPRAEAPRSESMQLEPNLPPAPYQATGIGHTVLPDIEYDILPEVPTHASVARAAAFRFSPTVEKLSPLKKALIFSEILGKPKSLREEELKGI